MSDLKDIQLSGGWCKHGIMEANRCDLCIDEWKAAGLEVNWQEGNATEFQKAFEEIMTTDNNEPKVIYVDSEFYLPANAEETSEIPLIKYIHHKEYEAVLADKQNLIQQAEIQAQEARTQRSIVMAIGELVGCRHDWEMVAAVSDHIAALQQQLDALRGACQAAEKWLDGWASAEPQLRIIRAALKGENNGN